MGGTIAWCRATPAFSSSVSVWRWPCSWPVVPDRWRFLYGFNPLVTTVQGFRWAMVGGAAPTAFLVPSLLSTLVMLIGGMIYFRRMEDTFADVV